MVAILPGLTRAKDHLENLQKLEADKAVIFAHAIEDEKPATSSGAFLGHATLAELQPRLAA